MKPHIAVRLVVFLLALGSVGSMVWAQHGQHYVLDAFGGVHAGGGAPVISPSTPYFGFDAAVDIEYIAVGTGVATGDGILVLDKFGGVHTGGALATDPPSGPTPYFGFDAARGIVSRNIAPRAAGMYDDNSVVISGVNFATVASVTIRTPDAGAVLAIATVEYACSTGVGTDARGVLALAADLGTPVGNWFVRIESCSAGLLHTVTVSTLLTVSAGEHQIKLLGRKTSGTAPNMAFGDRSLSALYVGS